jgi:hypothetical protein
VSIVKKIKTRLCKKPTLAARKADKNSKYWLAKADAAWSARIHEAGACAVCMTGHEIPVKPGKFEAHHLVTSRCRSLRHKISNGILLCSSHHKFHTKCSPHTAPHGFVAWHKAAYPDQYEWVMVNKGKVGKFDYRQAYEDLT